MSISTRLFSDAIRDMQRAFTMLDEPLFHAARRSMVPAAARFPATDVVETANGYELHAELPGVEKKNIHIELADNNTLILRGTIDKQHSAQSNEQNAKQIEQTQTSTEVVKSDDKGPNSQWWTNERITGTFSRSFAFPTAVKSDAIKASYKDGILSISVPKSEKSSTEIQIE